MTLEPTVEELALCDEISALGAALWDSSLRVEGASSDPKMFSVMLFKRLWSHHRGFVLLWNNRLHLEADILLRAGVEAAICLAANHRIKNEFVSLMRRDAAFTVKSQGKRFRADGDHTEAAQADEALQAILKQMPEGEKPEKLSWESLAAQGQVPTLYSWHRMLSGLSAHVTGVSVLRDVVTDSHSEGLQEELHALTRKMHLMMMAGATLQGAAIHAHMIGDLAQSQVADRLTSRMNAVTMAWLGVGAETA